jgi:hypothetical protein
VTRLGPLSVAGLLLCVACQRIRFTYEVPNGYVGWVKVSFDPKCREDVSTLLGSVIKVHEDGSACSRLSMQPRNTWVHAYYIDMHGRRVRELPSTGWGEGGMKWAEAGSLDGRTIRFFIGTEAQLNAAWRGSAGKLIATPIPPSGITQ